MRFWKIENKVNGADIYIYGEIASTRWDESDVTARSFAEDLNKARGKDVTVHLNSAGGDVFSALAIYNTLKNYKGNVIISIEGLAASAASLIVCAGDVVQMAANAQIMIHMPSVGLMGYYTATELEKVQSALVAVEGSILETYKSRLPEKNHAQVAEMMLAETWINATDAKELGFVDEITAEVEIKDLETESMEKDLIKDAVKSARENELKRIRNLMALRGENAAVNAIIETALDNGAEVSEVAKYIDAVKSVKTNPAEEYFASIRDNLKSGGENVGGSMPVVAEDKVSAEAKKIAEFANKLKAV